MLQQLGTRGGVIMYFLIERVYCIIEKWLDLCGIVAADALAL